MLGLSFETFTALHIGVSLAGIGTGLVALGALLAGRFLSRWIAAFLVTTALSVGSGFLFATGITPAQVVGVLTLLALLLAAWALYRRGLRGGWRSVFIAGATAALYFNVFVAVVQMFQKFPSLVALAPTQTEADFIVTQLLLLAGFLALGRVVWRS
jgi:succinate dehydrogenase/fumarate reductase cytochrome b subunit